MMEVRAGTRREPEDKNHGWKLPAGLLTNPLQAGSCLPDFLTQPRGWGHPQWADQDRVPQPDLK